MRRVAPKKSFREQLADNHRALRFHARQDGQPDPEPIMEMKPKRERVISDVPTESAEQRAFVKWFRFQYPAIRIFAIPNGGARDSITGAIMKAEGVDPGVPDLCFPAQRLFVEMKRVKGSNTSDAQLEWHAYLRANGYTVFVAYGCDDAMQFVKSFINQRSDNEQA